MAGHGNYLVATIHLWANYMTKKKKKKRKEKEIKTGKKKKVKNRKS